MKGRKSFRRYAVGAVILGLLAQASAGTARADTSTITEGFTSGCIPVACVVNIGFLKFSTGTVGLMSPGTTSDGHTYEDLTDSYVDGSFKASTIEIGGFSANPGQAWLISVSALGVIRTGASATYHFSGGIAVWNWPTAPFGFSNGGTTTVTVNHN
jgi:hypothetical protein